MMKLRFEHCINFTCAIAHTCCETFENFYAIVYYFVLCNNFVNQFFVAVIDSLSAPEKMFLSSFLSTTVS